MARYWQEVELYVAPAGWQVVIFGKEDRIVPLVGWLKQRFSECTVNRGADPDFDFGQERIVPVVGNQGFLERPEGDFIISGPK